MELTVLGGSRYAIDGICNGRCVGKANANANI